MAASFSSLHNDGAVLQVAESKVAANIIIAATAAAVAATELAGSYNQCLALFVLKALLCNLKLGACVICVGGGNRLHQSSTAVHNG